MTAIHSYSYISTFFPEWSSAQRAPGSSCPPEIWIVRCLRGFMFPMPQAFLCFPTAGLRSDLCLIQNVLSGLNWSLISISKCWLGSCEVENKSVYLVSHFPSFFQHWPCRFHHFQFLRSISCSFCVQSHGAFLFMRTSLLVSFLAPVQIY